MSNSRRTKYSITFIETQQSIKTYVVNVYGLNVLKLIKRLTELIIYLLNQFFFRVVLVEHALFTDFFFLHNLYYLYKNHVLAQKYYFIIIITFCMNFITSAMCFVQHNLYFVYIIEEHLIDLNAVCMSCTYTFI